MASNFTGLAFMHGHIVDRELILRLGRADADEDRGTGSKAPVAPRVVVPTAPCVLTADRYIA